VICPRCTIGTISDQTHECTLCGFAPAGGVLTETTFLADLDAAVRDEVERYFHPRAVLQHNVRSLVCLAEDRATERPVVLKILPMRAGDGPDAIDFVRHDLTLAATLEHPHIVPVQRFGVSAAACWYSTAYVPSPTLAESVRRSGPLDLSVAVRIVQQLASALDSAHRRGAIHGVLTPASILVDADGWARIADCGTARAWGVTPPVGPGRAPESVLPYLAPEWFMANQIVAPGADQYALSAVLYECLTGTPPFRTSSFEDAATAHREAPPPNATNARADIPAAVSRALQRAMAKRPSARFPNLLDFAAALADVDKPVSLLPPAAVPARVSAQDVLLVEPPPPPPKPPRKRGRWIAIAAACGVALLGAGAVLVFWPSEPAADGHHAADSAVTLDTGWATMDTPLEPKRPADTANVGATPTWSPETPIAPSPRALPPAHLYVNSAPWANVEIDGHAIGTTPALDHPLPPGLHRLRLTRDGYATVETTVRAFSGDTIRLTDITLTPVAP